jgi:hypothetical protein
MRVPPAGRNTAHTHVIRLIDPRVHLLGRGCQAADYPGAPHSADAGGAGGRPAPALLLARVQAPRPHRQAAARRGPTADLRIRHGQVRAGPGGRAPLLAPRRRRGVRRGPVPVLAQLGRVGRRSADARKERKRARGAVARLRSNASPMIDRGHGPIVPRAPGASTSMVVMTR